MNHRPIPTPSMHPAAGYSHATRVGNLLFVAGQIAEDKQANFRRGGAARRLAVRGESMNQQGRSRTERTYTLKLS
jgi:enamine deaminase RidA (YjgF/YER057c/UK114 family)